MDERKNLQRAVLLMAMGYVFLHIDVTIGINLLPDWVGYWLLYAALPRLSREEPEAGLLKPLAAIILGYGLLDWVVGIAGSSMELPVIDLVINVLGLYFHFQLLTNLASVVRRYGCPHERKIFHLRTGRTLLSTAAVLPITWEPFLAAVLAAYLIVVVWICLVLFTVYRWLNQTEI